MLYIQVSNDYVLEHFFDCVESQNCNGYGGIILDNNILGNPSMLR
jgi:hypothetical protein